jgi:hypothetical protein
MYVIKRNSTAKQTHSDVEITTLLVRGAENKNFVLELAINIYVNSTIDSAS